MPTEPRVTLEVRTPRESIQTAEAAVQLFSALPNPPRGIHQFWKTAPEFTFEFLNQGQTVYELVTVPAQLEEYVKSQLTAVYPEVLVKKLEHDPLQHFRQELPVLCGELALSSQTYFPFKTFREFGETESLAAALSAFAKLQEGESALLQLHIRKARDRWKKAAENAVAGSTGTENATAANPHKEVVMKKLAQQSFQAVLHLVVQAATVDRAQQIIDSIVTAYNGLQSQTNSFVYRKPFLGKKAFLERILQRQPNFYQQFFSVDELATLWHMPNKQLSSVRNIAWGKNLLGEPPENLPTFTNTPEDERKDLNLFARTEFKNQDQIFGIHKDDRRRHMYVIGKSGTGKSTLLANMIINDLKHGHGIAVVDPHGDLIETVLNYVPRHRINDVIVLDPADTNAVVKLNLFEGGSLVHRELIASGIVAIFQKNVCQFLGSAT